MLLLFHLPNPPLIGHIFAHCTTFTNIYPPPKTLFLTRFWLPNWLPNYKNSIFYRNTASDVWTPFLRSEISVWTPFWTLDWRSLYIHNVTMRQTQQTPPKTPFYGHLARFLHYCIYFIKGYFARKFSGFLGFLVPVSHSGCLNTFNLFSNATSKSHLATFGFYY